MAPDRRQHGQHGQLSANLKHDKYFLKGLCFSCEKYTSVRNIVAPTEGPPACFNRGAMTRIRAQLDVPGLVLSLQASGHGDGADGVLRAAWHGQRQDYAVEYKTSSTPLAVHRAMLEALRALNGRSTRRPLVVVPYLSERSLRELVAHDVSGIDLCGNCALLSNRFSIWRSGHKNQFLESRPLRNVFRGTSAVLVRSLLLHPMFSSLTAWRDFARERLLLEDDRQKTVLSLGTVSKVAARLEELLLLTRVNREIRVHDQDRLMESMQREYRPPVGRRRRGKAAHPGALFTSEAVGHGLRCVTTGLASAQHYGVLSAPDVMSIYVSDLHAAAALVSFKETSVFPTLELIEESADEVFFDGRVRERRRWASPVQTWLELAHGGPREREAAGVLALALKSGHVGDK
jgi:hypothetical protein